MVGVCFEVTRSRVLGVVAVLFIALVLGACNGKEDTTAPDLPEKVEVTVPSVSEPIAIVELNRRFNFDAVVISADSRWQIPLLIPALRRCNKAKLPHLLIQGDDEATSKSITSFLKQTGAKSVLVSDPSVWQRLNIRSPDIVGVTLPPYKDPLRYSAFVGRRFWKESDTMMVVWKGSAKHECFAGAIAARLDCPILFGKTDTQKLLSTLKRFKAKRVVCLGKVPDEIKAMYEIEIIEDPSQYLIKCLKDGSSPIRNLIVSRTPFHRKDATASQWLAPYMSLRRGSPIVYLRSRKVDYVESEVRSFLNANSLDVRSLTLLGDHKMIGLHKVSVPIYEEGETIPPEAKGKTHYTFKVDPFSLPQEGKALSYAVGRIPFADPVLAALLLANSYQREQMVSADMNAVVVANPTDGGSGFALAETVAKLSVYELKNHHWNVFEHYRTDVDKQAIREHTCASDLIAYQGHIEDQTMFDDPEFFMIADGDLPENRRAVLEAALRDPDDDGKNAFLRSLFRGSGKRVFQRFPVLFIQSCNSQKPAKFEHLVFLGGGAAIGSRSKIHSASGSTFMHAWLTNILYRGQTIGEALRDARNYFLCIQDLKRTRKHSELAQSYRATLSFCLWGDPDLKIHAEEQLPPKLNPPEIHWGKKSIHITLPAKRYKRIVTPSYQIKSFPDGQAAGIVKRKVDKGKPRRIVPMVYISLPTPPDFSDAGYTQLGGWAKRASFRLTPDGNHVYAAYFTESIKPSEEIHLRFSK